jgi:hypothetical protein
MVTAFALQSLSFETPLPESTAATVWSPHDPTAQFPKIMESLPLFPLNSGPYRSRRCVVLHEFPWHRNAVMSRLSVLDLSISTFWNEKALYIHETRQVTYSSSASKVVTR